MDLYPGTADWEKALKDRLKSHQKKLIPNDYAGVQELDQDHYLVTSCDGIGTKILLAETEEDFYNLGIDNVAMSLNDLICTGAKPLSYTNILSRKSYNPKREMKLLEGMIDACEKFDCTLSAGETADVPDLVHDFDLVGSATGIVRKDKILRPKETLKEGDYIYGIPSNSPHSNGYTLISRHFKELSASTKTWVKKPTALYNYDFSKIPAKGLAHVTGSGILKLKRLFSENLSLEITWPNLSAEWKELIIVSQIDMQSALTTFNCGIGLVVCSQEKIKDPSFIELGLIRKRKTNPCITVEIDGSTYEFR